MSLWGKTDDANSAPKYLSEANNVPWTIDKDYAFFVDTDEAGVANNQNKGLGTPGWNLHRTYTDSDGNTRYRSECLVAMKVDANTAGDSGVSGNTTIEDATVEDAP